MTLPGVGTAPSLVPYLNLMTAQYHNADVVVANDLAPWNTHPTFTGVAAFDGHKPGAFGPARAVQDVKNANNFWRIQMVSAFANSAPFVTGLAVDPVYIFTNIQTVYPTLKPQDLSGALWSPCRR